MRVVGKRREYERGDIVSIQGVEFVVLDVLGDGPIPEYGKTLFVMTRHCQFKTEYGETNDYMESILRERVDKWLFDMYDRGLDEDLVLSREIALYGYDGVGDEHMATEAAPLTLLEYWNYAKSIPLSRELEWLVTPRGKEDRYKHHAMATLPDGACVEGHCTLARWVRPAMTVSELVVDQDTGSKWVAHTEGDRTVVYKCSECGRDVDKPYPYCPNCGEHMWEDGNG